MRLASVVLALLVSVVSADAQVTIPGFPGFPAQPSARDATRNPVGSATVAGVVLTADSPGRPLRRVRVTLQSADLRAPISAITDDAGRFLLTGVVAGHYAVAASRAGYVDTILGASPGGMFGAPIAVADGQEVAGLTIRMPRGGVITGTVRLPGGRPARDVQLVVSPVKTVDGVRRMRFSGIGLGGPLRTDDRGVYRQFGLPPGDYAVQLLVGQSPVDRTEAIRLTTADEMAWADEAAARRGTAAAPGGTASPPPGASVMPAPIYFPGTTNLETAGLISLAAGEERAGVDLVVQYVPTSRVSGRVFDPDGRPQAGATVRLNGRGGSSSIVDMVSALVGPTVRTDENGDFTLDTVPPGDYTLAAQAVRPGAAPKPAAESPANLMTMVSGLFGRGGGAGAMHGALSIVVTGQDVTNLDVRLGDGATVSGRIVFEGTATPPAPATMQVMLAGLSGSSSPVEFAMAMLGGASAQVSPDFTFSLKGVVPNRYRATVNMPGALFGATAHSTWTVKSIRAGAGPDLADVPFDVEPGRSVDGLVVTLTDQPTVISGKVVDGEGRPSSAFPIVIFSTDTTHWLPGSRRVQQARPASDGTYRVTGLPAGEYYIGAVTTLDLDDLYDPAFLEQVVTIAFKIKLGDGEKKDQDLRIGG